MTEESETPASEDLATLFAGQETGSALEVGNVVKEHVYNDWLAIVFVGITLDNERIGWRPR